MRLGSLRRTNQNNRRYRKPHRDRAVHGPGPGRREDHGRGARAVNRGGRGLLIAAKYYRKAAECGYVPAQYNLGFLYENGLGVKQDFAEAAAWYRKAADQGDPESQNNLGVLYTTGKGVPLDLTEAVRLYSLAAAQEDLEGTANPASMYLQGRGVARDTARAFTTAAQRGYSVAQNNLAYERQRRIRHARLHQAYAWLTWPKPKFRMPRWCGTLWRKT